MTEKRFKNVEEKLDWGTIQYFTYNDEKLTDDEIENLVNQLLEENEQLKRENLYLKSDKVIQDSIKEVDYRISQQESLERQNNQLVKENKELKETIDELHGWNNEIGLEMEYINDIYKKDGFKGIIDYAKDQLSEYGLVREVDNGLWLFATGGWSDHEYWLNCLFHWNFMYAKGHYRCTTSGGGYYYSEDPYADITIKLEKGKECENYTPE